MEIVTLKTLKKLDFSRQKAFAYLTCERLYPHYEYFSKNFGFGNPDVLRKGIDFLHQHIFKKHPSMRQICRLVDELAPNVPELEEFTTTFAGCAAYACIALYESLCFLVEKDFLNIAYMSLAAFDSASIYAIEVEELEIVNDPGFQQKPGKHSLMKKEVAIQLGIITFLKKCDKLDYGDIKTLLDLQGNNGRNNVGL